MSYIERNLLSDERILLRTKKHLIIFFLPIVVTIFSVYATEYMRSNFILVQLELLPSLIALVFWCYTLIEYMTSEYAVTNKRVMMREGFFNRRVNELRLTTISQVNVDQSLFGQVLNYGIVTLNAFGAYDSYTLIDHPFEFQKCVNQQLDMLANKQ